MKSKLLAICAFLACAGTPLYCLSASSDPVISEAVGTLGSAYASDAKPADAKFTQCSYAQVNARHVARCGISYGGNELAQRGYWEIERSGSAYVLYAMNGKALSALDKITAPGSLTSKAYPGVFKSGQGRAPLDAAKIDQAIKAP